MVRNLVLSLAGISAFATAAVAGCYVCSTTPSMSSGSCGVGVFSTCTYATRNANNGESGSSTLGPGTHQYGCTTYNISNANDVISGPCDGSHPGYYLVATDVGGMCCWVKNGITGLHVGMGTTDDCGGTGCQGGSGES